MQSNGKPLDGDVRAILSSLDHKVDRLEALLRKLTECEATRERQMYTTAEFAEIVGRAEYTCRQWCLNERIRAVKADAGRGEFGEWRIPHEELLRYRDHGLLPIERRRRIRSS